MPAAVWTEWFASTIPFLLGQLRTLLAGVQKIPGIARLAATMIVAHLLDEIIKNEIEVNARLEWA
ncbi:hypothetical protein [Haliea sp. E17]|uniref:hypothetical protein n=1 Tax=Haliea sp. E17 TaxID=3401576 RepID=UPI003AB050AC